MQTIGKSQKNFLSKEQSNPVKNLSVTSTVTSPQYKWPQHYKTMLNTFSQQENENENHTESPSHPNQNGFYPKICGEKDILIYEW